MSILFAATYPDRVSSLILGAATARYRRAPEYPCGRGSDEMLDSLEKIAAHRWGQGATIDWFLPSRASSPQARQMFARFERMAVSPSAFLRIVRMVREIDVRAVLPAIHVPTLVIQRLRRHHDPPVPRTLPRIPYSRRPLLRAARGPRSAVRRKRRHRPAVRRDRGLPRRCIASPRARSRARHDPARRGGRQHSTPRQGQRPPPGRPTWMPTVPRSASKCAPTAVACARAPHKASSPPSTRPGKQFAPQPPSAPTPPHTESSYAPGSTQVKWTWPATRSGESPLTSSAASPPMPSLRRSSSPGPSKTWSSDPGSRSPTAARTN